MDVYDTAERLTNILMRKPEPRAIVIMGADSVRTCRASALPEAFLSRPGFVGVYDGRVNEDDLRADLEWTIQQMERA